jgi:hypothetical protein
LDGGKFSHIIFSNQTKDITILSVVIKENNFDSNIFLETLFNTGVEFSNCLISNNILTAASTSKLQYALFKLVASVQLINSIVEGNILKKATILNVTAAPGISNAHLEISSSEFNQNTGSDSQPLLLIAKDKNLKVKQYPLINTNKVTFLKFRLRFQ